MVSIFRDVDLPLLAVESGDEPEDGLDDDSGISLTLAGILLAKFIGKSGLNIRAMANSHATRFELENALKINFRLILLCIGRGTEALMCFLPISTSSPYFTPEGQVVSHDKHVKQRSRLSLIHI